MKTISFADKILEEKNVVYQDLEKKLSFKDNSIDTVIIFNVLEHVFDIDNSLEEINRVLKPGGKIIGSTPFIHRIHNAPSDYSRFTSQFFNQILRNKKFDNIEVLNFGFGPFTASYATIFDVTKKFQF